MDYAVVCIMEGQPPKVYVGGRTKEICDRWATILRSFGVTVYVVEARVMPTFEDMLSRED